MTDTIYLLDFRRGVVEKLDDSASETRDGTVAEPQTAYTFTSLGTPPPQEATE